MNYTPPAADDKNAQVGAVVMSDKANSTSHKGRIGLAIVPVKVKSQQGNMIVTHAFLDSGSNSSFCSEELKDQLHIDGVKTRLSLTTLEKANSPVECDVVQLEIYDMNECHMIELPTVFSRPTLPISPDDIPRQEDLDRWPHLKELKIPNINAPVGLLIGNGNPNVLEPKKIISSKDGGPYAVETMLGWTINGPLSREHHTMRHTANYIQADTALSHQFREFCNNEFNESIADSSTKMSFNDKEAVRIMDETIQLNDGHYEMALPLKNGNIQLPDNKPMAEHRLNLLRKRLSKDPDLHMKYVAFMNDLFKKGYAEKVPDDVYNRSDGMVWYLPHHSVQHPKKPDKVRVVFDCSARYRDTSLNDQLYQGPDMTNSLVGVLLRFRQEPVALMADITAMFHQVGVMKEYRDVQRFLWWPDGDLEKPPEASRMCVHIFGAASSPSCCNYALRRTAADNEEHFDSITVNTVKDNFYVDDCLRSTTDDDTAIRLSGQLTELLSKGGFHLTKWTSNSRALIEEIPDEERSANVKQCEINSRTSIPMERALGVHWSIHSDEFKFYISIKEKPATRRGILSTLSSVFDPLGFVAPIILPIKIMLQVLCKKGLSWDEPIPDNYLNQWRLWLLDLPKLTQFSIARCMTSTKLTEPVSYELHHFSDASEVGYGTIAYLRLVDSDGTVHCSLVMCKSRAAPLKTMTIPRLELSAAALSVRVDNLLRRELSITIDKSVFWTDSTAVLKFIHNKDRRFQTFVANRIAVIHDGSDSQSWNYVDSKSNPADAASRGVKADDLLENDQWSTGPGFLWQPEDQWPSLPVSSDLPDDHPDVKREKSSYNVITNTDDATLFMKYIFERFSSWHKLKKFVSWMLRLKSNLRSHRTDSSSKDSTHNKILPISLQEMNAAEKEIIKYVQRQEYPDELSCLTQNIQPLEPLAEVTRSVKKSSSLFKLDVMLRSDLLRVGGRLEHSNLPDDSKHQIVLPSNNHVTTLIIQYYHRLCGHSGREYVLSLLREMYWVVHGNRTVRKVLSQCIECRKRQAAPGKQKMANLPQDRVTPGHPPFSFVGVDFFGVFTVKRGRSDVKRYGCLFTCLSIRAIHIEVTHSLDTNSFMNALRRFIARRGRPKEIRSDNGSNLVSGHKEIQTCIADWNQGQIHEYLLQQDIVWVFNPPTGSHHGGVWERCIWTVRKIMMALLKGQTVEDEGLTTLMCEVEYIVNGRPITTVSSDHRDGEPLTPNHLLLLRSSVELPIGIFERADLYSRKRWRQIQYLADQFWRRWTREYLPLLQHRSKWNTPHRNFSTGDIVLLVDEQTIRNSWPLGRVIDVYPGKDGLVRRLKVKTKSSILERPIDKCVLLDAVSRMETS